MSENIHSPVAHREIWESFADRDYRHAYLEGFLGDYLAAQINAIRTDRGWSQAELARRAGVSQPQISAWENSCEGINVSSLLKIADAFDVAMTMKFVPFSDLARDAVKEQADRVVLAFDEESCDAVTFPKVGYRNPTVVRRSSRGDSAYTRYDSVGSDNELAVTA